MPQIMVSIVGVGHGTGILVTAFSSNQISLLKLLKSKLEIMKINGLKQVISPTPLLRKSSTLADIY